MNKPQPQKRNRTSFAVAPGQEPKGRQMCFRATPSLEERIEAAVNISGLKLADWLRQAVIGYLELAEGEQLAESSTATEPASTTEETTTKNSVS